MKYFAFSNLKATYQKFEEERAVWNLATSRVKHYVTKAAAAARFPSSSASSLPRFRTASGGAQGATAAAARCGGSDGKTACARHGSMGPVIVGPSQSWRRFSGRPLIMRLNIQRFQNWRSADWLVLWWGESGVRRTVSGFLVVCWVCASGVKVKIMDFRWWWSGGSS